MTTACLCIERDGEEVELVVEGPAQPEVPDYTRGHPDSWYEGEPAWAEVHSVCLDDGRGTPWAGELTRDEEREAESRLIEALAEAAE